MTPEQLARSTDQIAAALLAESLDCYTRSVPYSIAYSVALNEVDLDMSVAMTSAADELRNALVTYVMTGAIRQRERDEGKGDAFAIACKNARNEAFDRVREAIGLPDGCVRAHGDHDPACSLTCWILAKRDLARRGIHAADVAEALDIADATGAAS